MADKASSVSGTSSDLFHALLGKALLDEAYRDRLVDPQTRVAALQEIGVKKPTQDQLTAVQNSITTLQTLAAVMVPEGGTGTA
jgi:hypothetical protein